MDSRRETFSDFRTAIILIVLFQYCRGFIFKLRFSLGIFDRVAFISAAIAPGSNVAFVMLLFNLGIVIRLV